jgi:hypothetical protein
VLEIQAVTAECHDKKKGFTIKHKVFLDCAIKKTGGGVHNIDDLIVGEDHS